MDKILRIGTKVQSVIVPPSYTMELSPGLQSAWYGSRTAPVTIVYIHGGGFVMGSCQQWCMFYQDLLKKCGSSVKIIAIEYALAPKHPFPKAQDDCILAYEAILKLPEVEADHVFLMGDSAGGNLALMTVLTSKTCLPVGIILISPWLDLHMKTVSYTLNQTSDIYTRKILEQWRNAYTENEQDIILAASPGLSDNLSFLPPILVRNY